MALAIHDERLTRRVGAGVLVAAVLTVVFVVRVLDRIEPDGVTVRVRFGAVLGLPEGAAVRLAGHQVGRVRSIGIGHVRAAGAGQRDSGVMVVLTLERGWASRIPLDSDFFIDARNPLAPRYIAIGPPPGHAPPDRGLRDGDVVTGVDPPNLDQVLQRTWDSLTDIHMFVDALGPARARIDGAAARLAATLDRFDPHPGASAALRDAVGGTTDAAGDLIDGLRHARVDPAALARIAAGAGALAARIEATAGELRGQIAQIRAALDLAGGRLAPGVRSRVEGALAAADRTLAAAGALAGEVRGVIEDARSGGGAIAAFGADLELADEVKELTKELKRQPWQLAAPPAADATGASH